MNNTEKEFIEELTALGVIDIAWPRFVEERLEFGEEYSTCNDDFTKAFTSYLKEKYGLSSCLQLVKRKFPEYFPKYNIRQGNWKEGGYYGVRLK